MRRRGTAGHAGVADGELVAWERECAAAGDAERLAAVRSWRQMLGAGHPEVAELFAEFAREDRAQARR